MISITIMNMVRETIILEGWFCWIRFILLASVYVIEFQIIEGYSSLSVTKVKYTIYRLSKDGNEKATLRTRQNNILCENI